MSLAASRVLFGLFSLVAGSCLPLAAVYSLVFVRRRGASWRTGGALGLRLLAFAVAAFFLLGALSAASMYAGGGLSPDPAVQLAWLDDNTTGLIGLLAINIGFWGGIVAVVLTFRSARRRQPPAT